MLVTNPTKFSLVLIQILCVLGSCQKQDKIPPRINVISPFNNASFQIPCVVQRGATPKKRREYTSNFRTIEGNIH